MSDKTIRLFIRVNAEWAAALKAQVPNISEFIRDAVNEKIARDGLKSLPGEIGERGVRHDYMERKKQK